MTTERITLKQDRGATLKFEGTLLAQTNFMTSRGEMFLDVWKTQAGAYVASSVLEHGDTGNQERRAVAVEPATHDFDDGAMQRAIMDFFDWQDRARTMMRKQANWDLSWRVS